MALLPPGMLTQNTLSKSEQMDNWLLLQNGIYIYVAIGLALVGGSFGLPIPEDIPLIVGGVLINHGRARPEIMGLVCYLAILAGDLIIYAVGYRFGFTLFRSKWFSARVSEDYITTLSGRLEKHAIGMIFLARHLFYLRTATFLACGAFRMNVIRFLLIDAIAALISTSIMIGLGYLAAQHLPQLFATIHRLKIASLIIAALAVIAVATALVIHRRRSNAKSNRPLNGE